MDMALSQPLGRYNFGKRTVVFLSNSINVSWLHIILTWMIMTMLLMTISICTSGSFAGSNLPVKQCLAWLIKPHKYSWYAGLTFIIVQPHVKLSHNLPFFQNFHISETYRSYRIHANCIGILNHPKKIWLSEPAISRDDNDKLLSDYATASARHSCHAQELLKGATTQELWEELSAGAPPGWTESAMPWWPSLDVLSLIDTADGSWISKCVDG